MPISRDSPQIPCPDVAPFLHRDLTPYPPLGASGSLGAPGMGRIARHSRHVAPRKPNGSVRSVRPTEPTVTDGCLRRMARCTQRLHFRWIVVSPTTAAWHDVIDVCSDNAAARYLADWPSLQHRRTEAPPCLALVEPISGHRRCIPSSQMNRCRRGVCRARGSFSCPHHTPCDFHYATRHFYAGLRYSTLSTRKFGSLEIFICRHAALDRGNSPK